MSDLTGGGVLVLEYEHLESASSLSAFTPHQLDKNMFIKHHLKKKHS